MTTTMTNRELELLAVAKEILSKSPGGLALTGSLMLAVRGISKFREASDIDFIADAETFNTEDIYVPSGFKSLSTAEYANTRLFNAETNIKADTMLSDEFSDYEHPMDVIDGILCAHPYHMMQAKITFAKLDKNEESRTKHLLDVQYLQALEINLDDLEED